MAASADAAPNQTLYVSNVYDKLKKEETQRCLYALFGQFGKIVDVVCMRTQDLRGQAWVAFADITAATNALRSLQDFPFFDKPLSLQFAKSKSDSVAKLDGTWRKDKSTRVAHAGSAMEGGQQAELPARGTTTTAPTPAADLGPPNHVLFVDNLPQATTDAMLSVLFQQFPGFQQARMIPAKPGIAFVDFATEMQATIALSGLQAFKITPHNALHISYAKR